jgi:hypothetical protein
MPKVPINVNNQARRADKRLADPPVSSKVQFSKERFLDVDIINLSRRGLRFRSASKRAIGDKLLFELHSTDKNASLSLSIRAKVINDYGSKAEGQHEYGVRFYRLLYWYEMNCIHDYVYHYDKLRASR